MNEPLAFIELVRGGGKRGRRFAGGGGLRRPGGRLHGGRLEADEAVAGAAAGGQPAKTGPRTGGARRKMEARAGERLGCEKCRWADGRGEPGHAFVRRKRILTLHGLLSCLAMKKGLLFPHFRPVIHIFRVC